MRVIFMGTPDFSVPTLLEIIAQGHEVVAVYSQPPRPAGRGMEERKSPVHLQAEKAGIPVYTPASLKGEAEQQVFRDHDADGVKAAGFAHDLSAHRHMLALHQAFKRLPGIVSFGDQRGAHSDFGVGLFGGFVE